MTNRFDLDAMLNPAHLRPQPEAFPASSIGSLQDQSARRRNVSIEIMRRQNSVDETGGQSQGSRLVGQYSAWIQEVSTPQENAQNTGTQSVTRYLVGVPFDADIRLDDELASPGWVRAWRPGQEYDEYATAIPMALQKGNGHVYLNIESGISGPTEPDWPTMSGGIVSDGTCVWREAGEIQYLTVIGDDAAKSVPAEKVLICEEIR